jgi:histidinol dehydrogenase
MLILKLTAVVAEKLLASRRGRDRTCERVALRIVRDVRRRGDAALFSWARRLDGFAASRNRLWVSREELRAARRRVSREFLSAVDHASRNIRAVARRQRPLEWNLKVEPGVSIGQRVRPIGIVGCYVPGGRFSLVSTLLMTVIPAQEAGVERIIVASPRPSDELLAAADFLGIRYLIPAGGAQAIAALAYGTRLIPRVDKIFGPGNGFVTAAKRFVSHDCAIDLVAGPTEAVVFAGCGNGRFIAADLVAQGEHDPDAIGLFVTTSAGLGRRVADEIEQQLAKLPRSNPAHRSLGRKGAVLIARNFAEAASFINRFAPEHLSLPREGNGLLEHFDSAGSIFLGDWSAQSMGDYASGTNHVLPTGAVARARGGLSTADFVKCIGVQEISRRGLKGLASTVKEFARAEGLEAHGRAVEVRE